MEVKNEKMTYKQKKEYLKSYRVKHDRLEFVKNQIEGIQAIKYTPNINGPKKSLNAYIAEKTILDKELGEIEECINLVPDIRARTVLGYRYLRFKTYAEIGEIIGYSEGYVKKINKDGIKLILNNTV